MGDANTGDSPFFCKKSPRHSAGDGIMSSSTATRLYIKEHITTTVDYYRVRGLMSQASRVHLQPSGDTVFYKRIVFEHLDHARAKMKSAPHKLVRDVNSYKVEVSVEGIQFQLFE